MELLVTGAWQEAQLHIRALEESGHRIHFLQYERDVLPCSPDQIQGVICNGLFIYHDIRKFTKLQFIQLTSSGFDRVPLDYIKQHDIEIHNARGVYSIPMAEYAVAGVLDIYKKMNVFRDRQKLHLWEKQRNLLELYGKSIIIFGCGSVGCECAKRFAAFGAHVTGVKRKKLEIGEKEWYYAQGFRQIIKTDDTDKVVSAVQKGDIVLSAIPLSDSTRCFFDNKMFSEMKKNAIFVNISRGEVVDTKALIRSLKEQEIAGAVLDVFEEEPLDEESVFWDMNNCIVTPHNSFVGDGNGKRLSELIMSNVGGVKQCR